MIVCELHKLSITYALIPGFVRRQIKPDFKYGNVKWDERERERKTKKRYIGYIPNRYFSQLVPLLVTRQGKYINSKVGK